NQGTTSAIVGGNIVNGPAIAPGATQEVRITETGDGATCIVLNMGTVNPADAMDVLAYAPSLTSGGANIIPVANQNFSGWNTHQGSQVTITQGQPTLATTTYFHMDHLSNRVLTDSSGNSSGQQGHYPFGESWYAVNSTSKWVFTSYERDAESGNDYALAR